MSLFPAAVANCANFRTIFSCICSFLMMVLIVDPGSNIGWVFRGDGYSTGSRLDALCPIGRSRQMFGRTHIHHPGHSAAIDEKVDPPEKNQRVGCNEDQSASHAVAGYWDHLQDEGWNQLTLRYLFPLYYYLHYDSYFYHYPPAPAPLPPGRCWRVVNNL